MATQEKQFPERRQDYAHMQEQLNTLTLRVESLEGKTEAHMSQTSRIEKNTAELIETFMALKGAWVVLNWIAKLAKPITAIAVATAGAWIWWKDHVK